GLPQALALPIRPWNRPGINPKEEGKAPAAYDHACGEWRNLYRWNADPIHPQNLTDSDELGGNCGLILGVPATLQPAFGEARQVQFAAVDIDLDEPSDDKPYHAEQGLIAARDAILQAVVNAFGPASLIRETRPYRALVLVAHADLSAGHKHTFKIECQTPDGLIRIGKVELLTTGQQCVIAGKHPLGYMTRWYRADQPDMPRLPAPPLAFGLPLLDSFESVCRTLAIAFDVLRNGPFIITLSTKTAGANGAPGPVPATELAPASLTVDDLVTVIRGLHNVA